MQNTNLKTNIKSFIIVAFFLVGVGLVTAQSVWNNPLNQPGNNSGIFGPITDGTIDQEKTGQLVTSGIINSSSDMIVYSNLSVGNGSNQTPTYLFGKTTFSKMVAGSSTENKLCINAGGKVKICNDVELSALKDKYYTDDNVTKFPTSTGVTGYVSYKIGSAQSCQTSNLANTDWGGQTLSGTSSSKAVKFTDWGIYTLQMVCDGITYSTTIKIGGKIVPTTTNSKTNYTLNLGTSRDAEITVIGAGASGISEPGDQQCISGYVGGNSYVDINSTTIASAGGGKKATAGIISGCNAKAGLGGEVLVGPGNSGYDGKKDIGGCSGAPDSNNNLNTCNDSSATVLPYGRGGTGLGLDAMGGGGGAYVGKTYTLPATGTVSTFVGLAGGKNSSTPKGQNGYILIEW